MKTKIRELAEAMGYEITDWDIEQIMETKFHILVSDNTINPYYIKAAIQSYFEN